MSDCDDNARGYDVTMELPQSEDSQPSEQSNDNIKDAEEEDATTDVEAINLIRQFGELKLKILDEENEREICAIAEDQKNSEEMLLEKMQLLCEMTMPLNGKICDTVGQIDKAHTEILDKFQKLYNSDEECKSAYAAHCAEAIQAKKAIAETAEYDEFTEMPFETLEECIGNMESDMKDYKATVAELRAKRMINRKESEEKYNAIMKQVHILESIHLEGLEILDMKKFELEQRPRIQKQQTKSD
ncbi:uncharacterized protein LOC117785145 [Drosophila innubila]|uniref:uncharacterized protein LOC117785145 n=1 Tax=Drosophila innubila TaxID=198719 RepID=UPI00148B382A|nr:uncharacterized protein LOC117785145 [Drosophila innubila]